jgi:hypothetical protein
MTVIKRELLEFDPSDPTGVRAWQALIGPGPTSPTAQPSVPAGSPQIASKDWWGAHVTRIVKYKGPDQRFTTGVMELWDQLTNDRWKLEPPKEGDGESTSSESTSGDYDTGNDNGGGYA